MIEISTCQSKLFNLIVNLFQHGKKVPLTVIAVGLICILANPQIFRQTITRIKKKLVTPVNI